MDESEQSSKLNLDGLDVRGMDGATFVDGHLFFLTQRVADWAKRYAIAYRASFPSAEFTPETVRVYGWCDRAGGGGEGRPVLIVEGREIGWHWVEEEGEGGLFGGGERRKVEREMGHDWMLVGHRTELPVDVLSELMGEKITEAVKV